MQEKVNRMNSNLFKVSKQVGVPQSPLGDELKDLVRKGKRIHAIKELREGTGLGLLEDKNYVDSL